MPIPRRLRSLCLALAASVGLAACGSGEVYVSSPVVSVQPAIAYLELIPTRIGPETVRLDWSYDSAAYSYLVRRNGFELARVFGTSLIDDSGLLGDRLCYDVLGLSAGGRVISQSPVSCITLF